MFGEYYYDNDEIYEIETFQSESDDDESNFSISVLEYELPSRTSFIPGRSVLLFARLTYRVATIPSRAVAFMLKRLQRNFHNFTKAKERPASRNYEQKRTCS